MLFTIIKEMCRFKRSDEPIRAHKSMRSWEGMVPESDPFFEEDDEDLPLLDEGAWCERRFSISFASSTPPSKPFSSSGIVWGGVDMSYVIYKR